MRNFSTERTIEVPVSISGQMVGLFVMIHDYNYIGTLVLIH